MADDKKRKASSKGPRKGRPRQPRPPKHNAVHISIWSMNGEPVPQEVLDQVEVSVTMQALASPIRLLTAVTRT